MQQITQIKNVQENASLQKLNTFGVLVKSRYLFLLDNLTLLPLLKHLPKPHLILGGGSNILFTKDFLGTVILNRLLGIELMEECADSVVVKAMAGEEWHAFVLQMNRRGYLGLEYLSLIPGKVGAAPVQNIGAYGAEAKDFITEVEVYDFHEDKIKRLDSKACGFAYRDSLFKQEKGRYLILSVTFRLLKKMQPKISYRALQEYFDAKGEDLENLSMNDVMNAVIAVRSSKLPDPNLIGNAGSFFKNPIVTEAELRRIKSKYPNLVTYPDQQGFYKLAAGQLIELSGYKGLYEDGVGMYEKQALVLVNMGCNDGKKLWSHALKVQVGVFDKFGVMLEPEPLIL